MADRAEPAEAGELACDDLRSLRPDVSVIVPTRNRCALLERLLRQLVRPMQDIVVEVVVVDEASTDGTPQLLRRFEAEHDVVVVRNEEPLGLPGARNAGFGVSLGRYVSWIDDDDLTSLDRLPRQMAALEHTGRRWSCAGRVDIDDDLAIRGHIRCPDERDLLRRMLTFNVLPSAAQGLLVDRDLVQEVGGFDPEMRSAEDWEFCIRLMMRGLPHLLDEPLVGYRVGAPSMSSDTRRMESAIRDVLAKHEVARDELGVQVDWAAIHQSLLPDDIRRSRRAGVARAVRIARHAPSPKSLARCVAVALVPGRFVDRSTDQRRADVPDAWVSAARSWLDDLPSSD